MNKKNISRFLKVLFAFLAVIITAFSLTLPASALNFGSANKDAGIFMEESGVKQSEVDDKEAKDTVSFSAQVNDSLVYVSADKDAFAEGTELKVEEVEIIDPDTVNSIENKLENKKIVAIKALDITFVDKDGNEVQPKEGSDIKVSVTSSFIKENNDEAFVAHVDEENNVDIVDIKDVDDNELETISGEVTEELNKIDEINEVSADNTLTFEAESFSVYAIVYTVDFYYGETTELDNGETLQNEYEYHLEGGSEIGLIELFRILNIDAAIEDVEKVEFSNSDLLSIYQVEGNWILESKMPFDTEETLSITMADGTFYNIKVTDSQENNKWDVTIKLFDYDGTTPATAEEVALVNGKTYAIVALARDKETNEILGYKTAGTSFNGNNVTNCSIDLTYFRTLGKNDQGEIVDTYGQQFNYDPAIHKISIRLYEGTENIDQWQHKDYRTLNSLPASANGFEFLSAPNGNVQVDDEYRTTLNMKRAYDKQFGIRLSTNETGLKISEEDRFYAFVTVEHATTGTTYAYTPITFTANEDTKVFLISDWYDQNGNLLPNEKFTGNETVDVKIYTTNKDSNGNKIAFNSLNEIKNSQVKVLVADGDSINRYDVHYEGMQDPIEDESEKKTYYYDDIRFSSPSGSISKGDIDQLLADATDFGYYTERYVGHSGDIEATIGAHYMDTVFQSDFGYSSANVNVNRLKVLKIYKDGDGNPLQKPVTIRLKQGDSVKAEKSGTTDADGRLELEFDGLDSGVYDIVEIIDGQELSGHGSATVSDKTLNYNFSIDKAYFVNNKNLNYFGTIGENQDINKLKTMLEKASRVDVVILTDTQADLDRINAAKAQITTGKNYDILINGTSPYKHYDIKSDMLRLRQLSDDLASAHSSDTIRVINLKASEITENGLNFDDDGRYIVLNIEMDLIIEEGRYIFCPYILLDGKLLVADYGQNGNADSSKVLFNLRKIGGGCFDETFDTYKQGAGIILAPDANAHYLGGPFGGTIISHEVNRGGNELHSNNPNQIQTLNAVITNTVGTPTTGILCMSKSFSDDTKDKVTYFTFKVTLNNSDVEKVRNVLFPATGLRQGSTVSFDNNGQALVEVKAGNSVSIIEIPAGTAYTVEEITTPETSHFILNSIVNKTGTIEAGKTCSVNVINKMASFTAQKTVNNQSPAVTQRFDFKLDAYRNGYWVNLQTKQNNRSDITFDDIDFTETGTYFFKIYEDISTAGGMIADTSVYIVKAVITEESGKFYCETTYYKVLDNDVAAVSGDAYGVLNTSNVTAVDGAAFNNISESSGNGVLKVVKSVQPDILVLTDDQKEKITFIVKDSKQALIENGEFTLKDMGYNSETKTYEKVFTDLPLGTYSVIETINDAAIPEGYAQIEKTYAVTNGSTAADKALPVLIKDQTVTVTITNTYVPDTAVFSFTKLWKDETGNKAAWPAGKTIIVTLSAEGGSFIPETVELDQNGLHDSTSAYTWTAATENNETVFTVSGLPSGLTYYVTESKVSGYSDPVYAFKQSDGSIVNKTDKKALNNEYVFNIPENSYELPNTGGSGIYKYTLSGSLLILTAGFMLLRKQKSH